jgi:hypothetical protein
VQVFLAAHFFDSSVFLWHILYAATGNYKLISRHLRMRIAMPLNRRHE